MSNVSSNHDVVPFDSAVSKAFVDQRLAKVCYKTTKNGEKKQSYCVSIPVVTEFSPEFVESAKPFILQMIHDAQDGIVKGIVEEGYKIVRDEQINESAVLQFLASEAAGDRITKEMAEEWFQSSLQDSLAVAFADKLGISDTPNEAEMRRLNQIIAGYKGCFSALSGSKTSFAKDKAEMLQKAISYAEDGKITQKFQHRIDKMVKENGVELLAL